MGFFARRKKEKAIRRLKSQLGVDLYEKGTYNPEKSMTYSTHISEGDDFLIVLNRKKDDHLISKEWYLYDKKNGWAKMGSLTRKECFKLYVDTKPYYMQSVFEELGNKCVPTDRYEKMCSVILDEYLSSYMTQQYFGFSFKTYWDRYWKDGRGHTEAIYLPNRDPPPKKKTPEEEAEDEQHLNELIDELASLIIASDEKKKSS